MGQVLSFQGLADWRRREKAAGRRVVATNGCFDLLHVGHVRFLKEARALGDSLVVGLNGDASVTELKGSGRPVNPESDRAEVLAALEGVDVVVVFPEKRATRFLEVAQPDFHVKGGDYRLEDLDRDEREAVEKGGGQVKVLAWTPGKSTSAVLAKAKM